MLVYIKVLGLINKQNQLKYSLLQKKGLMSYESIHCTVAKLKKIQICCLFFLREPRLWNSLHVNARFFFIHGLPCTSNKYNRRICFLAAKLSFRTFFQRMNVIPKESGDLITIQYVKAI